MGNDVYSFSLVVQVPVGELLARMEQVDLEKLQTGVLEI